MIKFQDHLAGGVTHVKTSKKGGVIVPKFIVMHYTGGYTTDGDVSTLSKDDSGAAVSVHFVVGRDGEIVQIVPCNRAAWHAGPSASHGYSMLNGHSIGIEISNIGYLKVLSNGRYQDMYGNIIGGDGTFANGRRRTASPPASWHREKHPRLGSAEYAWEPYPDEQLAALDELVAGLIEAYPIDYIVSHEEIDTRKWKTDPGPAFPMKRYTRLLDDRDTMGSTYSVTVDELNVRGGPGTTYAPFMKLAQGATVKLRDRDGDWSHIVTETGKDGWVASRYLRRN